MLKVVASVQIASDLAFSVPSVRFELTLYGF